MNAPSQKLHLLPDYREKQHSATTTRALRGVYAHDAHARQDVLSMIKGS